MAKVGDRFGSAPVIKNSEPNFRFGSEAEIQTETSLCANDDETKTCREFTLEGIGQTSSGYAPHQRQQDPCSSRR